MTAPLEISPETAAFLGPDALARASDPQAVPAWTCPVCDQAGSLADPATPAALIVWHYLPARTTRIRYAHAACSPSALLTINASPPPDSLPGPAPGRPVTVADLDSLPPAIDLITAARVLGIGRTTAYQLARQGTFPCRVLRVGGLYRVATPDLIRLLNPSGRDTPETAAP